MSRRWSTSTGDGVMSSKRTSTVMTGRTRAGSSRSAMSTGPVSTPPGGVVQLVGSLERSVAAGARGLKVWKDLGLGVSAGGRPVLPDDPTLAPIWEAAGALGIPVLVHTADPVAFFEPVDRCNERLEELLLHPSGSLAPAGRATFDRLIAAFEGLVAANPATKFVGAHVGCYPENLPWVSGMLDRYPNLWIDTSARLADLGRQPRAAARLFERHADRILFGTDSFPIRPDEYRGTSAYSRVTTSTTRTPPSPRRRTAVGRSRDWRSTTRCSSRCTRRTQPVCSAAARACRWSSPRSSRFGGSPAPPEALRSRSWHSSGRAPARDARDGPLAEVLDRHVDKPLISFSISHPSGFWEPLLEDLERLGSLRAAFVMAVVIASAAALASVRSGRSCRSVWRSSARPRSRWSSVSSWTGRRSTAQSKGSHRATSCWPSQSVAPRSRSAVRWCGPRWLRSVVVVAAALVAIGVGWARVYLLSHLATDVLGSAVLGIGWVLVVDRLIARGAAAVPAGSGARSGEGALGSITRTVQPIRASTRDGGPS